MGYSIIDCRAGVFALLSLFLVPTLWGTLPCPYPVGDSSLSLPCGGLFLVPTLWGTLLCSLPCYGTDKQRHENHLYVDCPGVGQVARGLRTECRWVDIKDRAPTPNSAGIIVQRHFVLTSGTLQHQWAKTNFYVT